MPVTPTVLDSGSQTATISTLHTLNTGTPPRTTDGIFVLRVDVNALAMGDAVEFLCAEEIQNDSGTARDAIIGELAGAQGDNDWWSSPPLLLANGWDYKLRQTIGTGRIFVWSIWQL